MNDKDIITTDIDSSEYDVLASHYEGALNAIKQKDFLKANEELDIIYRLNPNSPYYYIAKLLIEFGFSSIEELQQKADEKVTSSAYFQKAYKYADKKVKTYLDSLKHEISVRENREKLKNTPMDQLLRILKVQKENKADTSLTISMILNLVYKNYRFVNKEYIEINGMDPNFLKDLNAVEVNFKKDIEELAKYRDIKEIDSIINMSVSEKEKNSNELINYFSLNLDKYKEADRLVELRNYLQNSYFNHEADALLNRVGFLIDQKPVKVKSHLGLIITTSVIGALIVCLTAGALTYYFLTNKTTIDGVTYVKNGTGYTIDAINNELETVNLRSEIGGVSVNALNRNAFYDSKIKEIKNFPSAITEIPNNAFYSSENLTRVEISSDSALKTIGSNAFEDCVALTTITLPSKLEYIEDNAFANCTVLNNLTFPKSLKDIGADAFLNTNELVNLTDLSGLKEEGKAQKIGLTKRDIEIIPGQGEIDKSIIGSAYKNYFYSWDNEVTIPVCTAKYSVFTSYSIEGITLPLSPASGSKEVKVPIAGLKSIKATAKYTPQEVINDVGGVNYVLSEDKTYFIVASINDSIVNATIEEGFGNIPVKEIAEGAFQNKTNLKSVSNIPNTLRRIPDNAFNGCSSLESITYVSGAEIQLEEIGAHAFDGCTSLKSFTIPKNVKTIKESAFANTPNLLNFVNESETYVAKGNGAYLGLTSRSISYDSNLASLDLTNSAKSYYVCDETIDIVIPKSTNRRVYKALVNGVDKSISYGAEKISVDVNGLSSINVELSYEGYYSTSEYSIKLDCTPTVYVGGNYTIYVSVVNINNQSRELDMSIIDVSLKIVPINGGDPVYTSESFQSSYVYVPGNTGRLKVVVTTYASETQEVIESTEQEFEVIAKS